MRAFNSGALVLAFLIACASPAWAAPAFAQTAACGSGATTSLAGAPANGDAVVGVQAATTTLVAATFKDSNAVSYAQEILQADPGPVVWAAEWDKIVSGTPNATFSWSVTATNCVFDVSGVALPGTYAQNNTASIGATLTLTLASVHAGDAIICTSRLNTAVGSATLASSNGALTADQAFAQAGTAHGLATATASTTITLTPGATGVAAVLICADLAAGGGGGGSSFPVIPAAGVYPGGYPPYLRVFLPMPDWRATCA